MRVSLFKMLLFASTASGLVATSAFAQQASGNPNGSSTAAGAGESAGVPTTAPVGATRPPVDADASAGDIIVTARRIEERLQDVPISITVFSQQQISERNIITANDLATYTPSLSSNARYGDESSTFALRGFVQENFTSPSVAVYFADVVGPRANGGTSGGNGAGVGAFFDLQNVQVLKGPQGTLFGRNTTGGAILLVPQKPTAKFGGYVEGSIGDYNMRRIQAALNVPISDTVRLRIGGDRQVRDGYLHNRSGIGPKDFANTDYYALRASLVIDLTPNLENYTIASYSHSNTNGIVGRIAVSRSGDGTNCPAVPNIQTLLADLACNQINRAITRGDGYYDVENGNPRAGLRLKQWGTINTTTFAATDTLTLKNIASYQEVRQAVSQSIFANNFTLPNALILDPRIPPINLVTLGLAGRPFDFVDLYKDPGRDSIQQWTATEEFQIQGRTADDKLTYQAGAYFEKSGPLNGYQGSRADIFLSCTDVLANQCVDPLGELFGTTVGFVQNSLTKYKLRNIGFYTQATYKLTDRLSVTGGIRYTIDKTVGTGATRSFTFAQPNTPVAVCANNPTALGGPSAAAVAADPSVCAQTLSQKSQKPTWLIDVDYKPMQDILVYAKYARGYRQGSLNVSNTVPNTWGPEKVDNYEIGAKTSWRGAVSGYFNITAFHADFNNQQLQASLVPCQSATPPLSANQCPGGAINPLASPAATIINGGKSRIQGVEIDTQISPFRGLRLNAGYTYLDTKLNSVNTALIPGYVPVTPNSLPGGRLTLSPKHKLTTTVTYTLPLDENIGRVSIGATYIYTSNQLGISTSPIGVLPATNLVNLNASWNRIAGSPIDLALFVTNLTNNKYNSFIGQSYDSTAYDSLIIGAPRMYGARLRYTF